VPKRASRTRVLAPAALLPLSSASGSVQRLNLRGGHYLCSIEIAAEGAAFAPYSTFFRNLLTPENPGKTYAT
jgi:hypothetical protein